SGNFIKVDAIASALLHRHIRQRRVALLDSAVGRQNDPALCRRGSGGLEHLFVFPSRILAAGIPVRAFWNSLARWAPWDAPASGSGPLWGIFSTHHIFLGSLCGFLPN